MKRNKKVASGKKCNRYLLKISALFFLLIFCLSFYSCSEKVKNKKAKTVKVYFGSKFDPVKVDLAIEKYKSETGILIESVFDDERGDARLKSELASNDPPEIYINSIFEDEEEENLEVVAVDAVGMLVNTKTLEKVAGKIEAKKILKKLKTCSNDDFEVIVKNLNKKLQIRNNKKINGVFSFAGASQEAVIIPYFNMLVENDDGEIKKNLAKKEFANFINYCELVTNNLAGEYASGIRGRSLIKRAYFDYANALSIFDEDKAIFTDYNTLYNLNKNAISIDEYENKIEFFPPKLSNECCEEIGISNAYVFELNDGFLKNSTTKKVLKFLKNNAKYMHTKISLEALNYFNKKKYRFYYNNELRKKVNKKKLKLVFSEILSDKILDEETKNEFKTSIANCFKSY